MRLPHDGGLLRGPRPPALLRAKVGARVSVRRARTGPPCGASPLSMRARLRATPAAMSMTTQASRSRSPHASGSSRSPSHKWVHRKGACVIEGPSSTRDRAVCHGSDAARASRMNHKGVKGSTPRWIYEASQLTPSSVLPSEDWSPLSKPASRLSILRSLSVYCYCCPSGYTTHP